MSRRKRRQSLLSPSAREQAERQLRQRRLESQGEATSAELAAAKRRRRWLRLGILTVFAVAIVGTWIEARLRGSARSAPTVVWDESVPDFGPAAVVPAGTVAIVDARLAKVEGLAPGSAEARDQQVALSREQQWPIEIANATGMRFRLIPPGRFPMGSPPNENYRAPDEPRHEAVVEQPFYLGMYEVTQGQWERVMGKNPSWFWQRGAQLPVEEVSWDACQVFLNRLSQAEGVPRGTYRLPTEAEWEYACRAGTSTAYHWGDTPRGLSLYANLDRRGEGPEPVGRRQPNGWGLFNMHGNVSEWCQDLFTYYDNPLIVDRSRRVFRGGNWRYPAGDCRSASRFRYTSTSHGNMIGLRVVLSLVPPTPME